MVDSSLVFNVLAKDMTQGVLQGVGQRLATLGIDAARAMGNLVLSSIKAGSDLAETQSKVGEIFGSSAGDVMKFADTAAKNLGQSKQSALDAASVFGIFGKSAGLSGQELTGFSTEMTTLASDLASFNNTTPEQAIEAIGAALRGESEPIRAYGVLLDDATLRARAMAMGITDTTETALTPQQKVLAAQAEILAQTNTQQGDFTRTSGQLANQQRILTAEWANAQAELGMALLPIVLKVVTGFGELVTWGRANQDWLIPTVAIVGGLVSVLWLASSALKAAAVAQALLNLAISANPIGLIILGVAALVAGIIILWNKCSWFRDFWIGVWEGIKNIVSHAGEGVELWLKVVRWEVDKVRDGLGWLGDKAGKVFGWVKDKAGDAAGWIVDRWNGLIDFVRGLPGKMTDAARGMWDGLKDAFKSAINWLIGKWNDLEITVGGGEFMGVSIPKLVLKTIDIPSLAEGGIVPATPGGRLVRVAEAGQAEAIVPLPRGGSSSEPVVTIRFLSDGLLSEIRKLVDVEGGGSVQLAFGSS